MTDQMITAASNGNGMTVEVQGDNKTLKYPGGSLEAVKKDIVPPTNRKSWPCEECGEDMLLAEGGYRSVTHPSFKGKIRVKNPDQFARFHKKCRTLGRKKAHDLKKLQRKLESEAHE